MNKIHLKFFLFFLTLMLFPYSFFAQKEKKHPVWQALMTPAADTGTTDYYADNAIRYEDYTYKKNIKTIQLRDESFTLSQPILNLESQEKLILSFDDLDAELKSYSYTIIHCNANWEPSELSPVEYIDGFTDNSIIDYSFSRNTLQRYIHYNVSFPNTNMRITKSGNYILKVFQDSDPDNLVLTRRFMVFTNKLIITPHVGAASIIEDRNYKQEIDFNINYSGYTIVNPYADLKIVITQNNRWDNCKTNLKPLFVKDQELVYDYDDVNVFAGGNEFRHFDIRSLRFKTEYVYSVKTDSSGNRVTLYNDEKKSYKRYTTESDMNGGFMIKVQEGSNSDVDADYCAVDFFLPYDDVLTDGNLYVFGAFNGWRCNYENLMHYNPKRFGYECTLYLKQGYYNYEYAFLKDGGVAADETVVEGSHYETENEYTMYVYHRQLGTFYDQLIAVKRFNSMRDY